jgi:hypothetical protein
MGLPSSKVASIFVVDDSWLKSGKFTMILKSLDAEKLVLGFSGLPSKVPSKIVLV